MPPLYPKSRIADFDDADQYEVTQDSVARIAEDALQAFYLSVRDSLADLYPDSTTWGDIDPLGLRVREQIAQDWVNAYAQNNSAVQEYAEEWCVLEGLEAMDVEALFHDPLPESLSVEVSHYMGGVMGVTLRGTRQAIYDFVQTHWDWDLLADVDEDLTPDCIAPDTATPTKEQAS